MAGVSLGGLASGLDTESMIKQLLSLERGPQTRLATQQRQAEVRQTALRDVQTKLRAARDAAADLRLPGTWTDRQTATASAPTLLTPRATGMAGSGAYSVNVVQLARAEQRTFNAATLPASFTVTPKTGSAYGVTVGAGEDAAAVAARINADAAAPVYAAAHTLSDGSKRLVLTSRTSGAGGSFTVDAGLPQIDSAYRAGQDAQVKVDSDPTVYTSSTNVVTGAIGGLELTLTGEGTTTVTVGAPALDKDAVIAAVKKLVDRYNDALGTMRTQLVAERVANPQSDADAVKGLLRGDAGLRAASSGVRLAIGTADAVALGISTGAGSGEGTPSKDAISGRLTVDEAALRRALDADPLATRAMAGRVASALEAVIAPVAGASGTLDDRLTTEGDGLKRLRDAALVAGDRLARTEKRLRAQFTALETALAQSQSRGQWLSGQLASLSASK
jgi:flagellar hook-associated protein 2